jgi:hypothetical protein
MATHAGHEHPATPAARAACRRQSVVTLPAKVQAIVELAEFHGMTVKSELKDPDRWTRAWGHLDLVNPDDPSPTHLWVFWSVNASTGRLRRSAVVYHSYSCNSKKVRIGQLWSWVVTLGNRRNQ